MNLPRAVTTIGTAPFGSKSDNLSLARLRSGASLPPHSDAHLQDDSKLHVDLPTESSASSAQARCSGRGSRVHVGFYVALSSVISDPTEGRAGDRGGEMKTVNGKDRRGYALPYYITSVIRALQVRPWSKPMISNPSHMQREQGRTGEGKQ